MPNVKSNWRSIGHDFEARREKVTSLPTRQCPNRQADTAGGQSFNPTNRRVLTHQAETVGNNSSDLACRTRLEAVIKGDPEKLTEHWGMDWHPVTFFADLKPQVKEHCARLKLELIDEA